MAIGAYAEGHGLLFSNVKLETVVGDGGVEFCSSKARENAQTKLGKVTETLDANARLRAAGADKMLAIEPAGEPQGAAPKKFYPILRPRGDAIKREVNVFSMFTSRLT